MTTLFVNAEPVRVSPKRLRRLLTGAVAILASGLLIGATMLAGRVGEVTTKDGRTFEGEINEKGGEVVVRTKGIETTLGRDDIATIAYGSYAERFEKLLASLKPDDIAGRVEMARDALGRGEFALANKAVGAALDIDPLDRSARELFDLIDQQEKAAAKKVTGAAPTSPGAAAPASEPSPREKASDLISEELINTIRQNELRAGDDRVRIRFTKNERKRYVDSVANLSYTEFTRLSELEQALMIIQSEKKDLVADVIIANDPPTLAEFNRRVQSTVVQGCATSQCHGGAAVGKLQLIAPSRSTEDTYINFHTLAQYQASVGEAGKGNDAGGIFAGPAVKKLIDRDAPARSLLLEFGLPKNRTESAHPEVKGYNGIFRDSNDPQYRLVLGWIESLRKPAPEYRAEKPAAPASPAPASPAPASPAPATPPTAPPATPPTNPK